MKTYQDWLNVADSDQDRMDFVYSAIQEHRGSQEYQDALLGEDYYAGKNTTIKNYEKILFNAEGKPIVDRYSANHKITNRFFYRLVRQVNSVLLGNGISWKNDKNKNILNAEFDRKIFEAGKVAMKQGTSYGFMNNDHIEIFQTLEFKPLYDEEDGALKVGIRFWQIDDSKPLRATLYEEDGYTEYIWRNGKGEVKQPKMPYKVKVRTSEADGSEIYDFENYPTFPIVPCWANDIKKSELLPIRATIDAYDLINGGYANDVDDANIIYWTITNAGGMNDQDLIQFLDKLRKTHAAQLDDDQQATAHTVEVPFEAREAILDRLEKQLYKDSMALNTYDLASGAVTATQIEAAYEPLNEKLDDYETQITDFIKRLLEVIGIDNEPTYTRSIIVNKTEEVNTVIGAANYLDEEYITEKVLTILGDKDQVEQVQGRIDETNYNRMTQGPTPKEPSEE